MRMARPVRHGGSERASGRTVLPREQVPAGDASGHRGPAACLPVVATRDNGPVHQISDGHGGLFVPHRDPAPVGDALHRLLRYPDLCCRLGQDLRRTVETTYSVPAVPAVLAAWWRLLEDLTPV